MIYKLLAGGAILVAAVLGGYFYGKSEVTAKWEADKAVWQASFDSQVKETKRIEAAWQTSKEQEHEWQLKAETAGTDAATVARSLRDHKASVRRCTLPAAAADPGSPGSPGAEPADIGGIEERHFANCAADASDYDTFHAWYNGLRAAQ